MKYVDPNAPEKVWRGEDKHMKLVSELSNKWKGFPVVVVGGGPSVPESIKLIPEGAKIIGVNHHWTKVKGLNADIMMYSDTPKKHLNLQRAIDKTKGKVTLIAPPPYNEQSDYKFDVGFWNQGYTSSVAVWLACFMTDCEVILVGMDCYQGKIKYFYRDDDTPHHHPVFNYPLQPHINVWSMAKLHVPRWKNIRVINSPLEKLFPPWEQKFNVQISEDEGESYKTVGQINKKHSLK